MQKSGFTMVELIFVIVIIGILAGIGIPKLNGVSDNAKKATEIATISALSTAIETAHGEWSINDNAFTWGNNRPSSELNAVGYPNDLNASDKVFGVVLKGENTAFNKIGTTIFHADYTISIFTGPASNEKNGVKFDTKATNNDITNTPDKNDFWIYASYISSSKTCSYNGKTFVSGDFLLIDTTGMGAPSYPSALTCN